MPRGDPFTALCQQAIAPARLVVADMHIHSTASDGDWPPSRVVAMAYHARLRAFTLTDHDTTAGWAEVWHTLQTNNFSKLHFVPGVELSTVWRGREYHLLGFFQDEPSDALQAELMAMQAQRWQRFEDALTNCSVVWNDAVRAYRLQLEQHCSSVGRRHVLQCIIKQQLAATIQEAWGRFVAPAAGQAAPKRLMPLDEAIELFHAEGTLAVLAHPPKELEYEDFHALRMLHLDGWEVQFPSAPAPRRALLSTYAKALGAVTLGGSDFHGPGQAAREIGGTGLTAAELATVTAMHPGHFAAAVPIARSSALPAAGTISASMVPNG
jgi:hypothetical protein